MVVPDIDAGIDGPVRISIDHMYLHERVGKFRSLENSSLQLIMVNHNTGRVWAYRAPNKGVLEGAAWLPKRIVQDIIICGYEASIVRLKADQEFAIVILQTAMQELKHNVIPT